MIDIASGHPAIDRYLADSYEQVRGMSSRFAAAICGHLIRRQSELGIGGELVEIGTFEGRFFIAMALGLAPGEKAARHRPLRLAQCRRRRPLPRQLRGARHRPRALRVLESRQPRDLDRRVARPAGPTADPLRAHRQPSFARMPDQRSRAGASAAASRRPRLPRRHAASRLSDDGVGGVRLFRPPSRDAPRLRHRPRGHRGGAEIPHLPDEHSRAPSTTCWTRSRASTSSSTPTWRPISPWC